MLLDVDEVIPIDIVNLSGDHLLTINGSIALRIIDENMDGTVGKKIVIRADIPPHFSVRAINQKWAKERYRSISNNALTELEGLVERLTEEIKLVRRQDNDES